MGFINVESLIYHPGHRTEWFHLSEFHSCCPSVLLDVLLSKGRKLPLENIVMALCWTWPGMGVLRAAFPLLSSFRNSRKGPCYEKQCGSGLYVAGVRMEKRRFPRTWALSSFERPAQLWARKASLQAAEPQAPSAHTQSRLGCGEGLGLLPSLLKPGYPADFVNSVTTNVSRVLPSLSHTHNWSC